MTSVAEAWALIVDRMPHRPNERVPIERATGRVLAEQVKAERDQPPFDRVTMDGIAISSAAWTQGTRRFAIEGTQAAGEMARTLRSPEGCIRVMTGAMRPDGTDAVIPIERVTIDQAGAIALVDDSADASPGRFIHTQGSDRAAGEVVLDPGVRLGPAEIAVLASAGQGEVLTSALAQVAIVSTGDELVDVDATTLEPYQIRSSNDLAIAASLERAGLATCKRARLRDDPDEILATVSALHAASDVLILSGGVSMGEFDFVPAVLESLGTELVFHRIRQKPGRPMWFGISRDGKPIFALPGNPVSTLLCMTRYVVPAMRLAAGMNSPAAEIARLSRDVTGPARLAYFVPVTLRWDEDGTGFADPHPTNTSGDFATLAATDGFIELPAGREQHPAGTSGRVFRW